MEQRRKKKGQKPLPPPQLSVLQQLTGWMKSDRRIFLVLLGFVAILAGWGIMRGSVSEHTPDVSVEQPGSLVPLPERMAGITSESSASARDSSPKEPAGEESSLPQEKGKENQRPEIKSIALSPSPAFPGNQLKVRVDTVDADGDKVQLRYRWFRNEKLVPGVIGATLETEGFKKNDKLTVEVVPVDQGGEGEKLTGDLYLMNRPPVIVSSPPSGSVDGRFIYQVKAEDQDGDPLQFELEDAPSGMRIDSRTGEITWTIPSDLAGEVKVTIVVSDGVAREKNVLVLNFSKVTGV